MHALDTARVLAKDIRETEEYKEYAACKERIGDDAGIKSLIREFKKLQVAVQMGAVIGKTAAESDTQRFQALSSLLFSDDRTREYLMAEIRLQRMMAEIFGILQEASGIEMEIPGI